jgi:spore germination cell wall hydrolase CwlJ-like protein
MIDAWQAGTAARTLYGEARGEGPDGMRAVAHVLLNRVNDGRWGPTLVAVCMAPFQFSCWNVGDPNRKLLVALREDDPGLELAMDALDDAMAPGAVDPTAGATHYYADSLRPPGWTAGARQTAHIGHHLFFAGVR